MPTQLECDSKLSEVVIREFRSGDEKDFMRLNEEWITQYWELESKDKETLAHPQTAILDAGGKIFFAAHKDRLIGCCALIPMEPCAYEISKMAVTTEFRGLGIGRQLLKSVIAEATRAGAHRLYLETNRRLETAIRLYESLGFEHLPAERIVPSPYARANVYMELLLEARVS